MPWSKREKYVNDQTIKNKRNYEELYYKARRKDKKDEYIDYVTKKL